MTPAVERVALLPCPFCGTDEFLITAQVRAAGLQWWAVECGCNAYGSAADAEAEAIAAWNTRAMPDDVARIVAWLKTLKTGCYGKVYGGSLADAIENGDWK